MTDARSFSYLRFVVSAALQLLVIRLYQTFTQTTVLTQPTFA